MVRYVQKHLSARASQAFVAGHLPVEADALVCRSDALSCAMKSRAACIRFASKRKLRGTASACPDNTHTTGWRLAGCSHGETGQAADISS